MEKKGRFLQTLAREEGVVSLEFVILFPVIVLVILAVLEFGHLWMVRHTLTIATREGARTAVVYHIPESGDRETWAKTAAINTVTDFLQNTAGWKSGEFTVPDPTVLPSSGEPLTGKTLTVRAQANEPLLVLHKLIKPLSVVGETTMRFE